MEVTVSLQGSLETFAIPDVLVLLSSTKKRGELRVVGGEVDGRLWFDDGRMVQARVTGRDATAVDAVFEVLRLPSGTFSFNADQTAPDGGDPQPVDLVLADAQARLKEWEEIVKVVPHLDAVVDMAAEAPGDEVTVTADQWKLLVRVAGGRSVRHVMEATGGSEFDTCKAVKGLVEAKLASLDASAKPTARPELEASNGNGAAGAKERAAEGSKPDAKVAEPAPAAKPEAKDEAKDDAKDGGRDDAKDGGKEPLKAAAEAKAEAKPEAREAARTDARPGPEPVKKPEPADPARVKATTAGGTGKTAVAATKSGPASVDADGNELVAQLAALGVDDDDEDIKAKVAEHLAKGGELPEAEGDEPINRGLLLKFLSSVRN